MYYEEPFLMNHFLSLIFGSHVSWSNLSAGLGTFYSSTLAEARLAPEGRLKAFDVDPQAVEVARQLEQEDSRHLAGSS